MKHVVDNLSVFEQFANMVYGLAVITKYERFLFAIFTEQPKQGAQLILCRSDYFFDGKLRRSIGIGRKSDGHKNANPGIIWDFVHFCGGSHNPMLTLTELVDDKLHLLLKVEF